MMTKDDHELHAAFAALRAHEPTPAELGALRRSLPDPEPVHGLRRALDALGGDRPGMRAGGAVALCTVAAIGGIAALPSGGDATGPGVLQAASAEAAEAPAPDGPVRWTKVLRVDRDGPGHVLQTTTESWVGAGWTGEQRTTFTKVPEGEQLPEGVERTYPFLYGDGPLAALDPRTLPGDRDAIARTLRDGIADNRWAKDPEDRGEPSRDLASLDLQVSRSALILLTAARLSPPQRSALLAVLADDPAGHDLGERQDALGRTGRAVELGFTAGDPARALLLLDPDSGELLQWEELSPTPGQPPSHTETIVDAGYVDQVGERP